MSRSLLRSVLLASCCTTAVACIDVGALKMPSGTGGAAGTGGTGGGGGSVLGSILLGDFEDHTAKPQDHRFANYQYYAYNPNEGLPPDAFVNSPLVAPGYNSNYGLGLNWEVVDVPDGGKNFPGVGVRTLATTGFVDLTGYDRLVFAQKYAHTGSCKPVQNLTASIGCNELSTSFETSVALSTTWTTTSLSFSTFIEPTYRAPSGHTLAECLALADVVTFQAQVDLADGDCASGSLVLDNIEIRRALPNTDGGADGSTPPPGIAITANGNGTVDGTNGAGVTGAWWSFGDYYGAGDAISGAGDCPKDGFTASQCSTIAAPTPGLPFVPTADGKMCTTGVAAQVIPDGTGQLAYSAIWGNMIGLDLNTPVSAGADGGVDGGTGARADAGTDARAIDKGIYDAVAHGITGFAFDIEGSFSRLRVQFATEGTWYDPAYWQGATMDLSPVRTPAHYEIRWAEVGGPHYLASPPPFDPSKLQAVMFHVTSDMLQTTPYSYCIKNVTMLTGP